ncbi:MAG: ParA family protein [Anaerolineae bacterium]|nr:ParA family protein [Anaerolineae bacterium]
MTKIYALTNQKGGVGKTTTAVNLGAYLSTLGIKVLIVDLDPQSNATSSLGIDKNDVRSSTYNVLIDRLPLADIILSTNWKRLFLAPASPALAGAEVELVSIIAREFLLRKALEQMVDDYAYILIDCPPSLGLLTVNALSAALDGVIIPVQCEYLALEGLTELLNTIRLVRENLNPQLAVRGLLMTMYDARTNLANQVVEEVKRYFPDQVFKSIIPRNIRLGEAPSFGQPIMDYDPKSAGARAYQTLTVELLRGDGWKLPVAVKTEPVVQTEKGNPL